MEAGTPPTGTPTDETEGPDDGAPRRRSLASRVAIGVVVLGLLSMWVYVVYLAFGPGRRDPADRLDDPAFAEAAETRCARAVADVEALPVASESPDAADRAAVVDEANAVYAEMLEDLEARTGLVDAGEQRDAAREWLADWDVYLGDREDFADRLREDPEARLLVSEKPGEGRHVTGWIDEFAAANRMPSCATPTDV